MSPPSSNWSTLLLRTATEQSMKIPDDSNKAAVAKSIERAFSKRSLFQRGPRRGFDLIGRIAFRNRIPYRQAALLVEEYAQRHNIVVDWSVPSYLQPRNIIYWGVAPALAMIIYSLFSIFNGLYHLHREHGLSVFWCCVIVAALFVAIVPGALKLKSSFNMLNRLLRPVSALGMINQP